MQVGDAVIVNTTTGSGKPKVFSGTLTKLTATYAFVRWTHWHRHGFRVTVSRVPVSAVSLNPDTQAPTKDEADRSSVVNILRRNYLSKVVPSE